MIGIFHSDGHFTFYVMIGILHLLCCDRQKEKIVV